MKTKLIKVSLFIVMLLSLTVLISCDNLSGFTATTALTGVQEVTLSSSKLNMNIETSVNCTFDQYFTSSFDPTVENEDLKKWCFVSLMDAHNVGVADFKSRPNTASSQTSREQSFFFLYNLGFENIASYTIGLGASQDPDDNVTIVYSVKNLSRKNGKGRHIINVSLCGADTASDWISNFDIGANVTEYGEHSEWSNKDNHKGYDVAASRVIDFLKAELAYTKYNNDTYLICLSGYSRGAAVANIVSQRLIDNPALVREKGFILADYNFACPRTTTSTSCHDTKYNQIHNYVNEEDLVTYLPPCTDLMNFQRYGVDHSFSIQNNAELKARTEVIAGNPYDCSCVPTVIQAVANMTTTREALYTVTEDAAHLTWVVDDHDNTTEEIATADYNAFMAEMTSRGVGKYFKFAGLTEKSYKGDVYDEELEAMVEKDITYYAWGCYVGDGIVLKTFTTAMTNIFCGHPEQALTDRSLLDIYTDYDAEFNTIVNAIVNHPDFFSDAHFPSAYFCGCFAN